MRRARLCDSQSNTRMPRPCRGQRIRLRLCQSCQTQALSWPRGGFGLKEPFFLNSLCEPDEEPGVTDNKFLWAKSVIERFGLKA